MYLCVKYTKVFQLFLVVVLDNPVFHLLKNFWCLPVCFMCSNRKPLYYSIYSFGLFEFAQKITWFYGLAIQLYILDLSVVFGPISVWASSCLQMLF